MWSDTNRSVETSFLDFDDSSDNLFRDQTPQDKSKSKEGEVFCRRALDDSIVTLHNSAFQNFDFNYTREFGPHSEHVRRCEATSLSPPKANNPKLEIPCTSLSPSQRQRKLSVMSSPSKTSSPPQAGSLSISKLMMSSPAVITPNNNKVRKSFPPSAPSSSSNRNRNGSPSWLRNRKSIILPPLGFDGEDEDLDTNAIKGSRHSIRTVPKAADLGGGLSITPMESTYRRHRSMSSHTLREERSAISSSSDRPKKSRSLDRHFKTQDERQDFERSTNLLAERYMSESISKEISPVEKIQDSEEDQKRRGRRRRSSGRTPSPRKHRSSSMQKSSSCRGTRTVVPSQSVPSSSRRGRSSSSRSTRSIAVSRTKGEREEDNHSLRRERVSSSVPLSLSRRGRSSSSNGKRRTALRQGNRRTKEEGEIAWRRERSLSSHGNLRAARSSSHERGGSSKTKRPKRRGRSSSHHSTYTISTGNGRSASQEGRSFNTEKQTKQQDCTYDSQIQLDLVASASACDSYGFPAATTTMSHQEAADSGVLGYKGTAGVINNLKSEEQTRSRSRSSNGEKRRGNVWETTTEKCIPSNLHSSVPIGDEIKSPVQRRRRVPSTTKPPRRSSDDPRYSIKTESLKPESSDAITRRRTWIPPEFEGERDCDVCPSLRHNLALHPMLTCPNCHENLFSLQIDSIQHELSPKATQEWPPRMKQEPSPGSPTKTLASPGPIYSTGSKVLRKKKLSSISTQHRQHILESLTGLLES